MDTASVDMGVYMLKRLFNLSCDGFIVLFFYIYMNTFTHVK